MVSADPDSPEYDRDMAKIACVFCHRIGLPALRPVPSPKHPDDMICGDCDTTKWGQAWEERRK